MKAMSISMGAERERFLRKLTPKSVCGSPDSRAKIGEKFD